MTALYFAAINGNVEVAKLLLECSETNAVIILLTRPEVDAGVIDRFDTTGRNPLYYTSKAPNSESIQNFVRPLVDRGAPLNAGLPGERRSKLRWRRKICQLL